MTNFARILLTLAFIALIVAAPHLSVHAQPGHFSLGVEQWVTVGQYTLLFRGLTGTLPSYDLYIGSVFVAHFPSPALPPSWNEYTYANVSIVTTGVASDGTAATGTITVR